MSANLSAAEIAQVAATDLLPSTKIRVADVIATKTGRLYSSTGYFDLGGAYIINAGSGSGGGLFITALSSNLTLSSGTLDLAATISGVSVANTIVAAATNAAATPGAGIIRFDSDRLGNAYVGDIGGTLGGTAINAWGCAELIKPTGQRIPYIPSANTDTARGTLLQTARTAASSGDTIQVWGPLGYHITSGLGKAGVNWCGIGAPNIDITDAVHSDPIFGDSVGGASSVMNYTVTGFGTLTHNSLASEIAVASASTINVSAVNCGGLGAISSIAGATLNLWFLGDGIAAESDAGTINLRQGHYSLGFIQTSTGVLNVYPGVTYALSTTGTISRIGTGYSIAAYASGTVATIPTSTALVDFGTTDPSIVLAQVGTYRLTAKIQVAYAAATITNQTLTVKIRRTTSSAADVASSTIIITLPAATALTYTVGSFSLPDVEYTTQGTNVTVQLWATLSGATGAGSVTAEVAGTWIRAERIR